MNKVYIGYQNNLPVRVESSRDIIENDLFLKCDRIEEYEGRAELVNGEVLFDANIDVARVAETIALAKVERATAVASITVEVDGMIFDGDEKAQERMARAVTLADSPEETTEWVLHDNTVAMVTAEQLRKACKLAGKTQTILWTKPYTDAVTVNETYTETNTHYTLE